MTALVPSSSENVTIVLVTLAEYQTAFWIPVAESLRQSDIDVLVCAFDDRSTEMLRARGIPCANVLDYVAGDADEPPDWSAFADYGIENVNLALSHERVTFRIRDGEDLARRLLRYTRAMDTILGDLIAKDRKPVLVQELGGFISVLAAFYAARRRGFDNWFIEPTFFRGRLFFIRNSFRAHEVAGPIAPTVSAEVDRYLDDTLNRRAIVIPKKDRHQYVPALGKVVNWANARRFVQKVYDKHVLGKHQEFGHIGVHARGHLMMAWNAFRQRSLYTELEALGPFVYYPLHVPADMALTLRSPEYFDQLGLIDYLCRVVPATHRLVIKEHPAQVGAFPVQRLHDLARRYDNLVLLPPHTNNYAVIERAAAVVSVNSKSGAEALLVGRPVIVLGDAFYTHSELVHHVPKLADVGAALPAVLRGPVPAPSAVRGYFQTVYDHSVPGELYVSDSDSVACFVASLKQVILGPGLSGGAIGAVAQPPRPSDVP